ncbi:universal stress protein [Flavobacterium sp. 7A]|uniref:universal stress protein n=1 Tax=Flavobacterium sp. 7A TaxID=2940571 RepID=UPI00222798AE|nr:universal stress protein [Flavobacterium sp. 7A]MCW2120839.1 nucleotide-binding universal stress UspA family protein [Flavobacterium sp. 7A]
MKRILFPTDFSEVANNAFVHALQFANAVEGELVLLHSYDLLPMDDQFFPENFAAVYDTIEFSNFELFKEEIPKLRKIMEENGLENIPINHRLMEGNLAVNIQKCIVEENIDYLIMGTTSATDWETLFSGSNSGAVVKGLKVPMLCIPLDIKYKKMKTIGFVTNYRPEDKAVLHKILALTKRIDAKVKCLYIGHGTAGHTQVEVDRWEAEFKTEPVQFSGIRSEAIKQVTLDFIKTENIDVLAVLTYKTTDFEGQFVANYSKNKAADIPVPLLVFHA